MELQSTFERFTELLARYDAALEALGVEAPLCVEGLTLEMQRRLKASAHCLRLLESVWPRAKSSANPGLPSPHFLRFEIAVDAGAQANSNRLKS